MNETLFLALAPLRQLLDADGVPYAAQPEVGSVHVAVRQPPLEEGTLTIRVQPQDAVLQFFIALPIEVADERVSAMESAIARINHVLAVAGFGLDHGSRVAYVRTTAPMPPGEPLHAELVRAWFSMTVRLAADFVEPLRRVAESGANPATILNDVVVEAALQATAATEPPHDP